MLVHTLITF